MPTERRRHAITETPRVQEALDQLRAELGTDRLDLGELVTLGAEQKLSQVRHERGGHAELRRRLVEGIRCGEYNLDPALADEARRSWLPE